MPALAADVDITTDTATVNLDGFAGTTAQVFPGVTVANNVTATIQAWQLTNQGTINGSNAVSFTQGGGVTNAAGAGINATLSGIVLGTSGAGGGAGAVDNFGNIVGGIGEGVTLFDGGTVTNRAGASISTSTGLNAVSVGQGTVRTVINSGAISSTRATGFSTGVLMQGGAATLTNNATGTIYGDYNGVFTSGSAPLTLQNDGSISSARGPAVEATGGGALTNTGTIQSIVDGIRFVGAGSITNTGTIGSTGAGRSIVFSGAATHTLNLGTGSVLNGNVQGGTGVDNLVLQGNGTESIAKFLAFETLAMQGADWTLTGAGTFTTSATVQSGRLRVGGTLTSPTVTVDAPGTLGGTGTVVGNVVNNGTLAPGNSIGTLAITGNYTQASGSTYEVEIDASPAADRVNVSGTATIQAGTTVSVIAAPGVYTAGMRYTILNALGGVSGTYSSLTDNSAFLDFLLAYDANNVYLDIIRASVSFVSVARTQNEIATAGAIEAAGGGAVFEAILPLSAGAARNAFDQLSGVIHASLKSALIDESKPRARRRRRTAAPVRRRRACPTLPRRRRHALRR